MSRHGWGVRHEGRRRIIPLLRRRAARGILLEQCLDVCVVKRSRRQQSGVVSSSVDSRIDIRIDRGIDTRVTGRVDSRVRGVVERVRGQHR